mmetsp:Transcript_28538/g.57437  ORF Transcript_28538/g.57437 Transcript_28538/m.57437 type:complete len:570 (+) Transcript_28538:252-1961(+)
MSSVQQEQAGNNHYTADLLTEWFNYCENIESMTEDGVRCRVDEFVQHGYQIEEDNEFLHALCLNENVTEGMVRYLLDAFPGADKIIDNIGQTPLHCACHNEAIKEEVISCLIEHFPGAAAIADEKGRLPLHVAFEDNPNVTLSVVKILIDAQPETAHHLKRFSWTLLHCFCSGIRSQEEDGLEILDYFIQNYPEQLRHVEERNGYLPIHAAAGLGEKSPEFCRRLLAGYPEGAFITASQNWPLHWACMCGTLDTMKFFYNLCPDGVDIIAGEHGTPVHLAIARLGLNDNIPPDIPPYDPTTAVEMIKFLLDSNPNIALEEFNDMLPISRAAILAKNPTLNAGLEIVRILYDAYPNAVLHDLLLLRVGLGQVRRHEVAQEVQDFITAQFNHARQSNSQNYITRRDVNGQLPLHTALSGNFNLGTIKLFVKGYSNAIQTPDISGALPLHIACQYHESAGVVDYLLGIDLSTLDSVDSEGNTPLHYACRGAKYDTITLLLEKYDAVSVSERNKHEKLPIDLLWESRAVSDRESNTYIESTFRLLKSNPELMMNYVIDLLQNDRKRKFDPLRE